MHSRPKFRGHKQDAWSKPQISILLQPILELKMKPQERLMTVCLRVVLKFQPFLNKQVRINPCHMDFQVPEVSEQDGRPNPRPCMMSCRGWTPCRSPSLILSLLGGWDAIPSDIKRQKLTDAAVVNAKITSEKS